MQVACKGFPAQAETFWQTTTCITSGVLSYCGCSCCHWNQCMHQLKVEATLSRLRWVCFHLAISRVGSIPTHPVLLSGWPSVGAILKGRDDSGSLTDGCREPGLC